MYEPYGMPQNPMQLAQQLMGSYQQRVTPQQLIRVTGMDGAKAYQMGPNSCVPLFDSDNDIMYIKSTDGAGFPTVRAFSFSPMLPARVRVGGGQDSGAQIAPSAPGNVPRGRFCFT